MTTPEKPEIEFGPENKPEEKPKKRTPKVHRKRGPARPYRKLAQELLDGRITKLQKRIRRAGEQVEEAQGFLLKYTREQDFRATVDAPAPA